MTGEPSYLELGVPDPGKARRFYAAVLGWPAGDGPGQVDTPSLDIGVHGAQISNQSVIYALRPAARSRITTAYISAYFAGAVLGSALAAITYGAGGWRLTCVTGAILALLPLTIWASTQHLARPEALAR